ncbi:MAG: tail fiber domain-containing protein [Chitinophagales bacterium]
MKKIPVILFCIALGYSTGFAQTGNVGVGNNTPVAKLDVDGDLALREGTAFIVSGPSPSIAIALNATAPENSFYRITGAPTGTMTLNSIANAVDGQIITLVNATSIKLKISNTNSAGGILTSGGAATIIAPNGSVTLQYSSSAARWFVTNAAGATITDWTKATTADEPAIKTDNQYVTGNVGIGDFSASNPDDNLDIISSSNINGISISGAGTNAAVLKLFDGATQKGGFGMVPATDAWVKNGVRGDLFVRAETGGKIFFDVSSGGANPTAMMIDKTANGSNVGIGTAAPNATLHVVAKGASDQYVTRFTQSNTTAGNSTFIGLGSENTSTSKAAIGFMRTDAYDKGDITFNLSNNNTSLIDATEADERMRIRSDGNVGINTTTPTSQLYVKSAVSVATTEIATFMANNSTYGVGITYNGIKATGSNAANALYLDGKSTGDIIMQTNATGDVGIGTATPGRKLEVNNAMKFTNSSGDPNDGVIGTAPFAAGLNIVGINTDATTRKISMFGGINQVQNDKGNYFKNYNYFGTPGGAFGVDAYILPTAGTYLRVGNASAPVQDFTSNYVYVKNRVHIGGTSSSDFPLFVEGSSVSTSVSSPRGSYYNTSYAANQGTYGPATDISAKFIGRVWATTSFEVSSDKRIKNIIGKTNNANDLTTLKQIEIVDYTMKDKIADGNREFKKVIAQDVAKVYPAVVTYSTDFVPDIFALYPIRYNENLATVSIDKSFGLKVGDKIRLINELNAKIDVQVISVADGAFSFVIPDNINRDSANIFVYGREVHDKALVDYDGLTTLNISATQELAKQLETAKAEIELLKKQNEALKTTKAGTEEVDQLKAQIDELKKLILNTGLKAENK